MTVTTETNTVVYNGDGAVVAFPFNFKVNESADLKVFVDGIPVAEDDTTYPYTPTGFGDNAGGVVTFTLNPPPLGTDNVLLARIVPATQNTDYTPYDDFPAETHEAALDKLTMIAQQNSDTARRSLTMPLGDDANAVYPDKSTRALKFAFFDSAGNVAVSSGTNEGGDGVQTVGITPDSVDMLGVDSSDTANPKIGVNNINGKGGLAKLTVDGQNAPGQVGGGLPREVLLNTPEIVYGIAIDDGTGNPSGIDSQDMLVSLRQADPASAVGFVEVIAVKGHNAASQLLQLDSFGQIPSDKLQLQGIRNRGVYRGDDACDKTGDEVGDCTAPDYRNPTQRFPQLDPPIGTDPGLNPTEMWKAGDYFAITTLTGEVDGNMNLFTEIGQTATAVVPVEAASDGITWLPQVLDPDDGVTVLVAQGWYHVPQRFSMSTAALTSYDPAGNPLTAALDVQVALDDTGQYVNSLDGSQIAFPVGGGYFIIDAATADVLQALLDLDAGALALDGSRPMTGNLLIEGATTAVGLNNDFVGDGTLWQVLSIGATGEFRIRCFDADGSTTKFEHIFFPNGTVNLKGRVKSTTQPTAVDDLTRLDWVQGNNITRRGAITDLNLFIEAGYRASNSFSNMPTGWPANGTVLVTSEGIAEINQIYSTANRMAFRSSPDNGTTWTVWTELASIAYVDAGDTAALAAANTYSDDGDAATLASANAYSDSIIPIVPTLIMGEVNPAGDVTKGTGFTASAPVSGASSVTWDVARPDDNYVVVANPVQTVTSTHASVQDITATGFTVVLGDNGGAVNGGYNFIVMSA